jgi:hypothetical protein
MKTMLRTLGAIGAVLALTPPAAAAEIQRSHEEVTIGFPADDGFNVYVKLHPQKRVAVFGAEAGVGALRSGIWSSTSYVKRVPRRSFGDVVHVDFGPFGQIDGRFVAEGSPRIGHLSRFCRGRRPVSEFGRFVGKVDFRGDGGWLDASTRKASALVSRTFRLRCKKGHAADFDNPSPGLFGYVPASTNFLSNNDGTYLHSILRAENLVTEFMALEHFSSDTVGFKAVAREWLPGEVATIRSLEVESAPEPTLMLGGPEQRPVTVSAQPPLPFTGAAEYTRGLGTLDGDLTASFLGKELPLAGTGSEAKICARPDRRKLWRCE